MVRMIRLLLVAAMCLGAASCSEPPLYDGPEVTLIGVWKASRKMYLFHHDRALKGYDIELGFDTQGPKRFLGDGKTPEGVYYIDRRNPNSAFHLSLGISYPNEMDLTFASSMGKDPGGDIFIHGQSGVLDPGGEDWTAGCIAVTNSEMREIYAMVGLGTPVFIFP